MAPGLFRKTKILKEFILKFLYLQKVKSTMANELLRKNRSFNEYILGKKSYL